MPDINEFSCEKCANNKGDIWMTRCNYTQVLQVDQRFSIIGILLNRLPEQFYSACPVVCYESNSRLLLKCTIGPVRIEGEGPIADTDVFTICCFADTDTVTRWHRG